MTTRLTSALPRETFHLVTYFGHSFPSLSYFPLLRSAVYGKAL
jgi:hypothetical protein